MSGKTSEYEIRSEAEWVQILKDRHMPYYPRFKKEDAEATYMKIRHYFEGLPEDAEKPGFCDKPSRIKKLEHRLDALYRMLGTVDSLDKLQILNIKLDIKYIEAKLKIRR